MQGVIVDHITKTYNKGSIKAVEDISFEVNGGELFGLIGPDGSGKTSLFRMLTTLILPDSGSAMVNGLDIIKDYRAIRNMTGYMPGKFSLYQDLTVEENLQFFATVFKTTIRENYDLIHDIYIQLEPFKNRRAGKLSGGMKQKLALCCALIHKPRILFLDEPTTGVDTVSRKEFWQMLQQIKERGITILVSTPYMDEATLCERIALIQNGKLLSINTPSAIINSFGDHLYAIKAYGMSQLLRDLRNNRNISGCNAFGEVHHITLLNNSEESQRVLLESLQNMGHKDVVLKPVSPTIEDCFIKLMNRHE